MNSMQKAAFFDRKGRGEGSGFLRLNQVFVHQTKSRLAKAGRPFFGTNGTLFYHIRNFGAFWNTGVVKIQRRIFDYHACQGIAILEGILADARDGFAAKLR